MTWWGKYFGRRAMKYWMNKWGTCTVWHKNHLTRPFFH